MVVPTCCGEQGDKREMTSKDGNVQCCHFSKSTPAVGSALVERDVYLVNTIYSSGSGLGHMAASRNLSDISNKRTHRLKWVAQLLFSIEKAV